MRKNLVMKALYFLALVCIILSPVSATYFHEVVGNAYITKNSATSTTATANAYNSYFTISTGDTIEFEILSQFNDNYNEGTSRISDVMFQFNVGMPYQATNGFWDIDDRDDSQTTFIKEKTVYRWDRPGTYKINFAVDASYQSYHYQNAYARSLGTITINVV